MPIEQIKIGDKVLSYDEKTKTYEYKSVAQTFIAVKENIVKIKIKGEKLLTTTTEHPFYVKKAYRARDALSSDDDEEGEWLTAVELKIGQKVLRPDGQWTRITQLTQSNEPTIVYNLEVEGNHNYFVGEIGVLSHNCAYRDIFFKAFPQLEGKVWVHHSIEQQVLKRYPGRFTAAELDQLENLRGIPNEVNSQLHLSAIRKEWNRFYNEFPDATREQILEFRNYVDWRFSNNFNPRR